MAYDTSDSKVTRRWVTLSYIYPETLHSTESIFGLHLESTNRRYKVYREIMENIIHKLFLCHSHRLFQKRLILQGTLGFKQPITKNWSENNLYWKLGSHIKEILPPGWISFHPCCVFLKMPFQNLILTVHICFKWEGRQKGRHDSPANGL